MAAAFAAPLAATCLAATFIYSLLIAAAPVAAQTQGTTPDAAGQRDRSEDRQQSGEDDPLLTPLAMEVGELGLKMHPPYGSTATSERQANGDLTVLLHDSRANPRWSMRAQLLQPSDPGRTPAEEIDDHLKSLESANVEHEVVSRESVTIHRPDDSTATGELLYLRRNAADGQPYISGHLVLPAGGDLLLVFSILTLPQYLEELGPVFQASFESIVLETREAIAEKVETAIERGSAFIASLSEDRLRDLLGRKQFMRIYRPARTTESKRAVDLGWSSIEVLEAKRGRLNEHRGELSYDSSEHELGLFVIVEGQRIESERNTVIDIRGQYWLAWDQSEESWDVAITHRQGRAQRQYRVTGLRVDDSGRTPPRATLTVIVSEEEARDRKERAWPVPPAYLSQPMVLLLPQLLPRDGNESIEYGFYCYHPAGFEPRLSRRRDVWRPSGGDDGRWILETTFGSESSTTSGIYDSNGNLVRREGPDGTITEPATLEELRKIWSDSRQINADSDQDRSRERAPR